ncbi:MAG: hypothetical protein JXA03_11105 [Bacteroidales bacterium]|nr:hypothetical protein [Bacteroidales bacterium]
MKKAINLLMICALIAVPFILVAQPAPWDPTIGGGEGNYPVGGGAPIGGGLFIMLGLAAGYASRKIFRTKK